MSDDKQIEKREKKFLQAVRQSGIVDESEIERSLKFQSFAKEKGRFLPLDRIMLKFKLLDEEQIAMIYLAIRYFVWRKEDKFYAKIAVSNNIVAHDDMKACLREQKTAFTERRELKRVNEIAFEKRLIGPREDRAIVRGLRTLKPKLTLNPLDGNPVMSGEPPSPLRQAPPPPVIGRGPAKKGEEEAWRKEVRARELAELSSHQSEDGISESRKVPPRDLFAQDDDDPLIVDDELPAKKSKIPDDDDLDLGDPLADGASGPPIVDDDLDPLWAEADLENVELDSGAADLAPKKGKQRPSDSGAEEATDLFGPED